jgi:eukaryotic-like serine/threonine-protein kinase
LIPAIWWIGVTRAWPLLVMDVLCVSLGALCFWVSRKPRRIGDWLLGIYLVAFTALLALSGIVLGPLLLMPIVIIGSLGNAITMRSIYAPGRIVASGALGFLIPLGLELGGFLPRTFHATASGLTLEPWAIDLSADAMIVAIIATFVIQMFASTSMLHTARKHMDRAQELVHLQSWHLQQIVR